ncbi:MAG: hypothetical protein H6719_23315 [Sandaracinaceae bacterium]|nr:hypothetical protein [Sandaracinaceae bacterium]
MSLLGALALAGCGAKTGLDAPDVDAGFDAGVDAGPPPRPCVEVPIDAGEVTAALDIPASLAVIDLMFLIDSTGSMRDEIDAVREGLRTRVVPGVRRAIPDAAFGVALFGEFPVSPHGGTTVQPYELRAQITTEVTRVEASLDETPTWGNRDDPEAAIEGLYQVVTGGGYGDPSTPGFIAPSAGCPRGGFGGACFRDDALPIVMLITDAPMHNGPPGVDPVAPYEFMPAPHGYAETVEAVTRQNVLIVPLAARDPGRPSPDAHLLQLARDTNSLDAAGSPLFFDIGSGGDRIGSEIVNAVEFVASDVPLDVDAIAEDLPGDAVDANLVLRGVRALRADPPANVERVEGDTFFGVVPGTRLTFGVIVDASGLDPSPVRRVFPARILFRASGRSRLEVRELDIVVPGDDGLGCEEAP